MIKSVIKGIGHYVPDNVVTNDDLSKIMATSDEWITERTGIKERRHRKNKYDNEETTSFYGFKASQKALKNAGITAQDIDYIIDGEEVKDEQPKSSLILPEDKKIIV